MSFTLYQCHGSIFLCLNPVWLLTIVTPPSALPFSADKLFGKRLLQVGRYIMSHKSWMKTVPTENCDVLMTLPGKYCWTGSCLWAGTWLGTSDCCVQPNKIKVAYSYYCYHLVLVVQLSLELLDKCEASNRQDFSFCFSSLLGQCFTG